MGSHCGSVEQTNQPGVCVCVCVCVCVYTRMCMHSSEIGPSFITLEPLLVKPGRWLSGFSNPQNPSGIDLPGGASEWPWAPPQKTRALNFTYKLSYA